MEDRLAVRWAIAAPQEALRAATTLAGLDGNALRRDVIGVGEGESALIMPSYFCPEPPPWLAVLAQLIQQDTPIRVYILQTAPDRIEDLHFSARLYPRLEDDMRELLRDFAPDSMAAVSHAADRVELAMSRLRQAAALDGPPAP
jgi:hypothetical protein